jgi:WD40 repeat protein
MTLPAGLDPKAAYVASQWPHDRPLNACRLDPAGRFVFCGAEDATVQRFKLPDGARTGFNGGHETWVQAFGFSKDSAQIVSGGYDGKLTWWETASDAPKPVRTIEAHKGWIRAADVSPDGAIFATGGNDTAVRLWNVADGKLIRELPGHERHVYSVLFHPSGQFLLTGDLMGMLNQWEVATGKLVRTFDAKPLHTYEGGQQVDYGGIRSIALSTDGKWLAAGGLYKGTNPLGAVNEPLVLLFDWESQKLEKQQIAEGIPGGAINRLRWLADGTLMGSCGGTTGGFLLFWKPDAEKSFHRLGLPANVRDMDLHPDGIQVATAHVDKHLRITRLAAKPAA